MTVLQAREAARQWIAEEGRTLPGFCAAYTGGSTNWLPDDACMTSRRDLDVMVVVEETGENGARRKFVYRDVLLEVSYLGRERFGSSAQVLSDYHLAPSLRTAKIIVDPFGFLAPLLKAIYRDYAKRKWVRERCENARQKMIRSLRSIPSGAAFPDLVIACLFSAGIATHVLLAAGLRNPTVRARYQAVRDLLAEYGMAEFHEVLLEGLGTARISVDQAREHVATLACVFDEAKAALRTPVAFAPDLSDAARAIAIDGSLELIARGYHREAMFWVGVMHSRCQKVLELDAPSRLTPSVTESYRRLTRDLGLAPSDALRRRCAEIERMVPRVCNVANAILAANREVEDD